MQIEIPDQVIDALRDALMPVIEHLVEERVEQRRPMLLSVTQVANELSCSRASVYGLIHGGHLEATCTGRTYRVATATLHQYVEELTKPMYEREVVSSLSTRVTETRLAGSGDRGRSREAAPTSVHRATERPRPPRTKKPKISKKEFAESRCTVAEFADRWWGFDSATALLKRSGVALTEGSDGQPTFRYGDIVEWMETHESEFAQWTEEFDPVLNRRGNSRG
jgi:excisionase family DNA binding protein